MREMVHAVTGSVGLHEGLGEVIEFEGELLSPPSTCVGLVVVGVEIETGGTSGWRTEISIAPPDEESEDARVCVRHPELVPGLEAFAPSRGRLRRSQNESDSRF